MNPAAQVDERIGVLLDPLPRVLLLPLAKLAQAATS
jgi:hypothetical protein